MDDNRDQLEENNDIKSKSKTIKFKANLKLSSYTVFPVKKALSAIALTLYG